MANPKRQHSKTRGRKRRSHDALTPRQLVACPHCREAKQPHRICPSCGMYKGRQVLNLKEE